MTDELRRFLTEHLPRGAHAVLAVSGGPDSMALLHAASCLRTPLDLRLTCAHFNHHLRGADADADERFVREQCALLGMPFVSGGADVAAEALTGESLEEAARRLRYAFLRSVDPDAYLLTAHNANDNLETMLMHLIRGASLRGLSGIPPVRGKILRPLLRVTRGEILAYLAETGTPYRLDTSNDSDAFLRNRVRRHIVPLLIAENPSLAHSAQAAAERLREEDQLLDSLAAKALDSARKPGGLSCAALRQAAPPLLRRALRLFFMENQVLELSARQIEAVCALTASSDPAAEINLAGGITAAREYDLLYLRRADAPASFAPAVLAIPGTTKIPALHLQIRCQIADTREFDAIPCDFAVHYTGGAITVRPRETGDTIRLPGGRRTLKKLMIDRKIPAARRALVPVFADEQGVLAVYGIGIDRDRLPRAGERVLYLKIERETCSEHS